MYIQQRGPELPFSLPRDYSGSAFRNEESAPPVSTDLPNIEEPAPIRAAPPAQEEAPPDGSEQQEGEGAEGEDTVTAFAPHGEEAKGGGLLARLPFLSSLLPPPRKRRREKEGGLPEWAMIAVILLLLTNDSEEDDILPFLILLLLWN